MMPPGDFFIGGHSFYMGPSTPRKKKKKKPPPGPDVLELAERQPSPLLRKARDEPVLTVAFSELPVAVPTKVPGLIQEKGWLY